MGLFEGLLGGAVGGEMISAVNGLLEKHGGVQGVMARLEQQGLGATAKSWAGPGENLPISADQLHQAFGSGTIQALAAKAGLNPQELAQKLSQALPQIINKLTPPGAVQSS